jgi:hypothetical protein
MKLLNHVLGEAFLNFFDGNSKILFGTVDSEDATYYTDKISDLEKEQSVFFLTFERIDNSRKIDIKVY